MIDNYTVYKGSITNNIYIARLNKAKNETLEKRIATGEVMNAVTDYVLEDMPDGATINYTVNGKKYEMTVKPVLES